MTSAPTFQLAAVTDVANAPARASHYAVALEGRKSIMGCFCCDYADAMLSFFAPSEPLPVSQDARVLSFHRSLVQEPSLRLHFGDYPFFGYLYPSESLHISRKEMAVVSRLLDSIAEEMAHGVDEFTGALLAEKVNLLLTNCRRFHQRQMILREDYCKMHVDKAVKIVDRYYSAGHGCDIPPVGECADQMGVSAAYLQSVIRFVTGKTFREFAQLRQLHMAKTLLTTTDRPVADIARSLGFPSEGCFEEFFRIVAGTSPSAMRNCRC